MGNFVQFHFKLVKPMKKLFALAIVIFMIACTVKNPEIKLPAIISDNMVLQ